MYRNRERQALADYEDDTPAFRPQAPVARTGMWYQQRRSGGNLPEVRLQIYYSVINSQSSVRYITKSWENRTDYRFR